MDELSFEQALAELETTVARLEEGNLPLDEMVKLYQRGKSLAEHCQQLLDRATLQVRQLTADGGEAALDVD